MNCIPVYTREMEAGFDCTGLRPHNEEFVKLPASLYTRIISSPKQISIVFHNYHGCRAKREWLTSPNII